MVEHGDDFQGSRSSDGPISPSTADPRFGRQCLSRRCLVEEVEKEKQIDLPPILMLLKANDKNHPLEMQERFIASYRKRGGAIEVHTFDEFVFV